MEYVTALLKIKGGGYWACLVNHPVIGNGLKVKSIFIILYLNKIQKVWDVHKLTLKFKQSTSSNYIIKVTCELVP